MNSKQNGIQRILMTDRKLKSMPTLNLLQNLMLWNGKVTPDSTMEEIRWDQLFHISEFISALTTSQSMKLQLMRISFTRRMSILLPELYSALMIRNFQKLKVLLHGKIKILDKYGSDPTA